jgi:hypothetical protein
VHNGHVMHVQHMQLFVVSECVCVCLSVCGGGRGTKIHAHMKYKGRKHERRRQKAETNVRRVCGERDKLLESERQVHRPLPGSYTHI